MAEIYSPAQSRSMATDLGYWWDIDKKNNVILYRFIKGTNNKNVIGVYTSVVDALECCLEWHGHTLKGAALIDSEGGYKVEI